MFTISEQVCEPTDSTPAGASASYMRGAFHLTHHYAPLCRTQETCDANGHDRTTSRRMFAEAPSTLNRRSFTS